MSNMGSVPVLFWAFRLVKLSCFSLVVLFVDDHNSLYLVHLSGTIQSFIIFEGLLASISTDLPDLIGGRTAYTCLSTNASVSGYERRILMHNTLTTRWWLHHCGYSSHSIANPPAALLIVAFVMQEIHTHTFRGLP